MTFSHRRFSPLKSSFKMYHLIRCMEPLIKFQLGNCKIMRNRPKICSDMEFLRLLLQFYPGIPLCVIIFQHYHEMSLSRLTCKSAKAVTWSVKATLIVCRLFCLYTSAFDNIPK